MSEIFRPPNLGTSGTYRFFTKLIPASSSKRSSSFLQLKPAYIDTSLIKQRQFLMQTVRKSSDFKNYDISPQSPQKTSRSRYCLKLDLDKIHKHPNKVHDTFIFRMPKNRLSETKPISIRKTPSQATRTQKNMPSSILVDFLKNSVKPSTSKVNSGKIELSLSKRQIKLK